MNLRLNHFLLTPTTLGGRPAFRLDLGPDDSLLLTAADLEQLRHEIDRAAAHVHNDAPNDPDAHVVFDSVCCGAQLYRCSALVDGLPSKPLIRRGEDTCAGCGAELAQF